MAGDVGTEIELAKADEGMEVTPIEDVTVGPVVKLESFRDDTHVNLTWRSWMVVL